MKTKFLLFSLLLSGLFSFQSVSAQDITFDDGATWKCDQFFAARPLRYMKQYRFFDDVNNNTKSSIYLKSFSVKYKNGNYLSVGQLFDNGREFDWTADVVNRKFVVPAKTSLRAISTRNIDWGIVRHPNVRSNGINQWDFLIGYNI